MRPDAALLKADVQEEMTKLQRIVDELALYSPKFDQSEQHIKNTDKIVIGYYLHSFYNGCENIFRSVARFFENEVTPDSWHKDLLRRMKLEVQGYRPKVIAEETYQFLNDFRGFRHRFRHAYSFELDWEREKVVARKLKRTWEMLQKDIEVFLHMLETLPDEI